VKAARVSQFDKDDVEAIGLVKFDFLGLRTLTIIDWALKAINQRRARLGQAAARMLESCRWTTSRATSCCRTPRPRRCSSWNRPA
jgi:hypothetical protein